MCEDVNGGVDNWQKQGAKLLIVSYKKFEISKQNTYFDFMNVSK